MSKVLYVKANPKSEEQSFSLSVGRAFISAYKSAHPNDEIVEIDLFKSDVPFVDAEVFGSWGKLQNGIPFNELSQSEQGKLYEMSQLTEQVLSADKYVFASPLWNLSLPTVLRAFIDSMAVQDKTFKYADKGPEGLLKNKKALHIQASGNVFSEGPAKSFEHGVSYLRSVLNFLGVQDVEAILVEGTANTAAAHHIKAKAIECAKEIAKSF